MGKLSEERTGFQTLNNITKIMLLTPDKSLRSQDQIVQ